jgi:hypothetical protein
MSQTEGPPPLPPQIAEAQPEPQPATAPVPEGWEGILEPGERILWQGRPTKGLHWSELTGARTIFGLAYAGFAVFWIYIAAVLTRTGPGALNFLFPLFGLPFLVIGLNVAFGTPVREARRRRGTFYTLTDRAAFVASIDPKRLERFPLGPDTRPVLEEGNPGTVWFAESPGYPGRGWRGMGSSRRYTSVLKGGRRVGFETIPDARDVYALMLTAIRSKGRAE